MLRSFRLGEADRVLHLYTLERGRIGAVAKGIRKTKSRFGARLEPLSHVDLMLHQGAGELQTVTGVQLIRSHHDVRETAVPARCRPARRRGDAAASSPNRRERTRFQALTRFLGLVEGLEPRSARAAFDPLALSFQLKLLWLSGYLPHLTSCAELWLRDRAASSVTRRAAGGAVCRSCNAGAPRTLARQGSQGSRRSSRGRSPRRA